MRPLHIGKSRKKFNIYLGPPVLKTAKWSGYRRDCGYQLWFLEIVRYLRRDLKHNVKKLAPQPSVPETRGLSQWKAAARVPRRFWCPTFQKRGEPNVEYGVPSCNILSGTPMSLYGYYSTFKSRPNKMYRMPQDLQSLPGGEGPMTPRSGESCAPGWAKQFHSRAAHRASQIQTLHPSQQLRFKGWPVSSFRRLAISVAAFLIHTRAAHEPRMIPENSNIVLYGLVPSASKQGGIGIVLQPGNENGEMIIVRIVPNGPADQSGKVIFGDVLESVDGMLVQGMQWNLILKSNFAQKSNAP